MTEKSKKAEETRPEVTSQSIYHLHSHSVLLQNNNRQCPVWSR